MLPFERPFHKKSELVLLVGDYGFDFRECTVQEGCSAEMHEGEIELLLKRMGIPLFLIREYFHMEGRLMGQLDLGYNAVVEEIDKL